MPSSPTESVEGSHLLHSHNASLNKPLNSPRSESCTPLEVTVASSKRWLAIYSLLFVVAYLVLGVTVYTTLSGMSALDSLYFCIVTLTTVGYGDLSAHKPLTKLFACFYILIGVAMVAAILATLVESLLDQQEALLMGLLKKRREEECAADGPLGNGSESSLGAPTLSGTQRANLKLTNGIGMFLMLLVIGAAVFKFSGNLSIIDALYLTVVSASTVGYGDYYPSTQATKIFAVFFLPLSTLLLGKVISDYTEMRVAGSTEARQKRILEATITKTDYHSMDADGDGLVSPYEFMCRTLVAQEKVTQEDVDKVSCRFSQLDKDGSGFIEFEEC